MIASRLEEARGAAMLLTRLPLGRPGIEPPPIAAGAWAFPLVGACIGALGWAAFAVALACGLPPAIAALLAVTAGLWSTGALHEDGLADFADGIGGGRDRETRLAIMRDSRIGAFGALALIVAVGLRVLAIKEVGAGGPLLAAFVAMGAASRFAMAAALALMVPARANGLGSEAGRPGPVSLVVGFGLTVLCLAPLGQAAAAVGALMAMAAAAVGVLAQRKIAGQTGDVLGAVQVVAELAGWLALVAVLAA